MHNTAVHGYGRVQVTDAAKPPIPYALGRRMTVGRMHETLDLVAVNPQSVVDEAALRAAAQVLRPRAAPEPERRQVVISGQQALEGDARFGDLNEVADAVEKVAGGERDQQLVADLARTLGAIRRKLAEDMVRDMPRTDQGGWR